MNGNRNRKGNGNGNRNTNRKRNGNGNGNIDLNGNWIRDGRMDWKRTANSDKNVKKMGMGSGKRRLTGLRAETGVGA